MHLSFRHKATHALKDLSLQAALMFRFYSCLSQCPKRLVLITDYIYICAGCMHIPPVGPVINPLILYTFLLHKVSISILYTPYGTCCSNSIYALRSMIGIRNYEPQGS